MWFEDLHGFLMNQDAWFKFIPDKNYTLVENLNAFFRFSIIFSTIVIFIKKDFTALYFTLAVAIFTYIMYMYEKKQNSAKKELFDKLNIVEGHGKRSVCYKPTKDNPFMNVTLRDHNVFPNRPPACDITRASVKRDVKSMFDDGLYRDVDDIFHKKASDRQFYTTASTTIPNDQRSFAEWCYKTGKTLKESTL